jgi:Asp-tRNA(Asn)/Glu-tRNA(Gln) amidotransferase A subunit family amidase
VGVPKEPFEDPVDSEVEHFVRNAIELLGKLGATIHEISWPMYHESKAIASTILMAEATAYHSQLMKRQGSRLDPKVCLFRLLTIFRPRGPEGCSINRVAICLKK